MFDKNNEISFSSFYIHEFFRQTLEQSADKISDDLYAMLQGLGDFLLDEKGTMPGLEKLAQYQGTNELSIFLFDLTERIREYPALKTYSSIPNTVEDFINLYSLMMEEEVAVKDLGKVVDSYKPVSGADKKKEDIPAPAVLETVKEVSFAEFYQKESQTLVDELLSKTDKDHRTNYTKLIEIFKTFSSEDKDYDPLVIETENQIREVFNEPSADKVKVLEPELKKLIDSLRAIESENITLFEEILNNGQIPELVEEGPKDTSVDGLLRAYFLSEIGDYVQQIKEAMRMTDRTACFSSLQKTFKSLKEVSMIHGYSGVEYFAEQLLQIIAEGAEQKAVLSEESKNILNNISAELKSLDNFGEEKQVDKINNFAAELFNSFTYGEVETEIAFSDQDQLLPILKDVLTILHDKLKKLHKKINDEETLNTVNRLISRAAVACEILFPTDSKRFFDALQNIYQSIPDLKKRAQKSEMKNLNKILKQMIKDLSLDFDFAALAASIEPEVKDVPEPDVQVDAVTEEVFSLSDDEKIRYVVGGVLQSWWTMATAHFKGALLEANADSKQQLDIFAQRFNGLVQLVGYNSSKSLIKYFQDVFSKPAGYDVEQVSEIQKSLELAIERISSTGKEADFTDILEVLPEILQPEEAAEESIVDEPTLDEPAADDSAVDELEQDFLQESTEQLSLIRDALENMNLDGDDRLPFQVIVTGIHAIRSSAHLLNKNDVSDFAINLEETAEMFESSDVLIPKNFKQVYSDAIDVLENLILSKNPDTSQAEKQVDDLLNSLIVEEAAPTEVDEVEEILDFEEEPEIDIESEKPLFAEEDDLDDDLLDIFREESDNYLATLAKSNEILSKDLANEQALEELEQAAHSLHSSAKMMGFKEISLITETLDHTAELILNNEVQNSKDLQINIATAIQTIQSLRSGEKVKAADITRVVNQLESPKDPLPSGKKEVKESTPPKSDMAEFFTDEADVLIENLNRDILELEQMPESATLLPEILRNLHTLKGSAMMVKYIKIGELSHKLEDYFQLYKHQTGEIKQEMINPVFTALDLIQAMVASIRQGKGEDVESFMPKIAELDNKLFFFQNFDQESLKGVFDSEVGSTPASSIPKSRKEENVVKINTGYLDNLVNMATELVVNRTELVSHFDVLKGLLNKIENGKKQVHSAQNFLEDLVEDFPLEKDLPTTSDSEDSDISNFSMVSKNFKEISQSIDKVASEFNKLSTGFEKNILQISNLSKKLHSDILKVRMIPIEYLFDRFPRPIRDLAKEQGKRITFSVVGNNAEMDRAMVEALADPLMHVLRNAVDHGIEKGEERKKLNKSKIGKITLRASQEKSQVVIDVIDNGRGINIAKVGQKAVKLGLVTKTELEKLTEAEILDFIFYSEFSTKDKATGVSGRGVGLNVVANQIQKLKGVIRVKTDKNKGTTFSIRVPLTLIVSHALMTKLNNNSIAIPMIAIQESFQIDEKDILVDDDRRYVQARGKLLPYITLDEILNYPDSAGKDNDTRQVLILHDAGISVALGIGEILGKQEIVIKTLSGTLQNVEYIAGGTILGSGEVALILDYSAIIRMVEFQFFGNIREQRSVKPVKKTAIKKPVMDIQTSKKTQGFDHSFPKKKIKKGKPCALILDDSSSVRNFVGSVLEKEGYSVQKAISGKEALTALEKKTIDVIITDLEMPNMTGFEFIEQIRADKKYDAIPIVILTGKTSKAQQNKGSKLGANAFVGKPFKESDLIEVVNDFFDL